MAGASVEQGLRDHRDRSVVPRADRRHQRDRRPDPGCRSVVPELAAPAKQTGFSDAQIAGLRGARGRDSRRAARAGDPPGLQDRRHLRRGVSRLTPYHYSSYDAQTEVEPREKEAVIILGSGPNRIGQGIEFDYSCVHATLTLREAGYEAIMVNCNPETVSTDYDTANRLYFEPLTLEDVLEVITAEQAVGPVAGVICQLGGQTPLGLPPG